MPIRRVIMATARKRQEMAAQRRAPAAVVALATEAPKAKRVARKVSKKKGNRSGAKKKP